MARTLASLVLLACAVSVRCSPHLTVYAYYDPICKNCNEWMRTQFEPTWKDPEFRPLFGSAVEIKLMPLYAFGSDDDKDYVQKVNCAKREMEPDEFVEMALCAESAVFHTAEKAAVLDNCVPEKNREIVKACAADAELGGLFQKQILSDSPEEFHHVPWVGADGKQETLAHHDFKAFLCSRVSEKDRPSSCPESVESDDSEVEGCGMGGGTICLGARPNLGKLRLHRNAKVYEGMPECAEMIEMKD